MNNMVNEERRKELLEKLKLERELRKQKIQEGYINNSEAIILNGIIQVNHDNNGINEEIIRNPPNMQIQRQIIENIYSSQNQPEQNSFEVLKPLKKKESKKNIPKPKCQIHIENNQINEQKKIKISFEERQQIKERLQQDSKRKLEYLNSIKQQQEQQEFQQNCTFTPQINELSNQIAIINKKHNSIEDRLIVQGLILEKKLNEKRSQSGQEEFSYHPNIDTNNLQVFHKIQDQKPIYERFADESKKKQDLIFQIQQKIENENQNLFKPQICQKSVLIAKNTNQDVTERLIQEGERLRKKKEQQKINDEVHKCEQYQFHPNLEITEKENQKLLSNVPIYSENVPVYERQNIVKQFYQDKLLKKKQEIESQNFTFHPKTNTKSESNSTDIGLKLYNLQKEKEIKLKQKQQEQSNLFTFQPQINSISKILAPSDRQLDELAYNIQGQLKKQQLKEDLEDSKQRECSFYPSVCSNDKYRNIKSQYEQEQYIMDHINGNQVKQAQQKKQLKEEQLQKEMKDCTFQPVINSRQSSDNEVKLQYLKGIETYMRNKDQGQKIKNQKKEIDDKVFGIHQKYDSKNREKFTTPVPFNLSSGNYKK